jgi:hemoglobin
MPATPKISPSMFQRRRLFPKAFPIVFAMFTVAVAGCSVNRAPAEPGATADVTLFQRLGGQTGVDLIVRETLETVSTDPRTKRTFAKVDMKRLNTKIAEHICSLTNGNCKYSGDNMKQTHGGMNITEAEFYLMVEFLRTTLDRHVGEREKNELLRILAPMKGDVVSG